MKPSKISNNKPKPKIGYLKNSSIDLVFEAIGTIWNIQIKTPISPSLLASLEKTVQARIDVFDKNYSRFREDSLVSEISLKTGIYRLPTDAKPMLNLYFELYNLTNALMTPLIGNLLSDAGYDKNYSFQPGKLIRPPSWEDSLEYSFPDLIVKQPVLLDFGAAGKGYLIDLVGKLIESYNINDFSIYAGGDILVRNSSKIDTQIGLEHPDITSQMVGVAQITNQSICGSAANRRVWGNYHHIFNPSTLRPTKHIKAVWVIADSTLLADGLTTALFFTDAHKLTSHYNFEYAVVRSNLSLEQSSNFPANFFTEISNGLVA